MSWFASYFFEFFPLFTLFLPFSSFSKMRTEVGATPPFPPLGFAALVGGPPVSAFVTRPAFYSHSPAPVGASVVDQFPAGVADFFSASLGPTCFASFFEAF